MYIDRINRSEEKDEKGAVLSASIYFENVNKIGERISGTFAIPTALYPKIESGEIDIKTFVEDKIIDLLQIGITEDDSAKFRNIESNIATQKEELMATMATVDSKINNSVAKITEMTERAEATRKSLQNLVLAVNLSDEAMADLINIYDEWTVGADLVVGDIVRHEGELYQVIQAHTTQADWTPLATPSLFTPTTPPQTEEGAEIIPEWRQPTGGHDAYKTGDRVLFESKIYESTIDGNVWSPSNYPQGWKEVTV